MRVVCAIVGSVLIHALLAGAIAVCFSFSPTPDVKVDLDLSSVELSFSEKDDEISPVMMMPPSPAMRHPPKPEHEKPPEVKQEKPLPPDSFAPCFREPKEEPCEFEASSVSLPVQAPRQARIDAPPCPKRTIRPEYPMGARQRGEQGNVTLEFRVNADGSVEEVKVVGSCGFAELDAAAVRAVKVAKFTPAKSGRENVAASARLNLSFKLK